MNFFLGLIIGILGTYFIMKAIAPKNEAQKNSKENTFQNPAVEVKKENIAKLKTYIGQKLASDKITNDEIQKFMKVSDATATRYLDKLEQMGLIKQIGDTGHDVYYLKI